VKQKHAMWVLAFLCVPLCAYAQAPQPAAGQQPPAQPEKKAKKVWTNDDLATLPANSPVSTATATVAGGTTGGEAAEKGAEPGAGTGPAKPGALPPEKDPKVYREKLDALRKRLDEVEAKIKSTQDAMNGSQGGSNAVSLGQATPTLRPADQLAALEKERQDIQQQIDDLESQARKNDITPGDIR
jgi:hypothetical protein